MEIELICTKHDFKFGFNRHPSVEPAELRCPICAEELIDAWVKQAGELREHRDLLLKAIDLKQLLQRAGAVEQPTTGSSHG